MINKNLILDDFEELLSEFDYVDNEGALYIRYVKKHLQECIKKLREEIKGE